MIFSKYVQTCEASTRIDSGTQLMMSQM